MNHRRTCTISMLSAVIALAPIAAYATTGNHTHKTPSELIRETVKPGPNSPRMQAYREQAKAELEGRVTAQTESASGWKAKYNLYVGCTTSPAGSTYSTIQDAVAAAYPYTSIHVCPGTYSAGGADTGISVNTSFIEIVGVSPHAGAETVVCDSTPNPSDDSWGIYFAGSYSKVKNMTFNDCYYGMYVGDEQNKHDEVSNSWFNGDTYGIYSEYGDHSTYSNNHFQTNYDAIYAEFDYDDTICGNRIEGDGSNDEYGIYIYYGIGTKIASNSSERHGIRADTLLLHQLFHR